MIYERIIKLLVFKENGEDFVVPIRNNLRYTLWLLSHFREVTPLYIVSGSYKTMYAHMNFFGKLNIKKETTHVNKTIIKVKPVLPSKVPSNFMSLLGDDYILYKDMEQVNIEAYLDDLLVQGKKLSAEARNWSYIENYVLVHSTSDENFKDKYSSLIDRLDVTQRVRRLLFRKHKITNALPKKERMEIEPIYNVQDIELDAVDRDYYESMVHNLAYVLQQG